jgi:hypothetical protein
MAVDQKPDLTFDFAGELGEVTRQLLGDDALGREATPIQMFETPELPRLQTRDKAMDTRGTHLPFSRG